MQGPTKDVEARPLPSASTATTPRVSAHRKFPPRGYAPRVVEDTSRRRSVVVEIEKGNIDLGMTLVRHHCPKIDKAGIFVSRITEVWILQKVTSERGTSDQLNTFLSIFVFWVGATANTPKSDDKYALKVFNWSEGHFSEVTFYKIHTLRGVQLISLVR